MRMRRTSRTTTGFMAGCSSSSFPSRNPAPEATFRLGSPSLFASAASSRASASGLARSSAKSALDARSLRYSKGSSDVASSSPTNWP